MLLLLVQALQPTAPGLADNLGEDVEREGAIRKIAVFENRIVTRSAEGGETSWYKRQAGERGDQSNQKYSYEFRILDAKQPLVCLVWLIQTC